MLSDYLRLDTMDTYDVTVRRDGRFWFVEIPSIDGATQARSLVEVDEMAREYIALSRDLPADSFDLHVRIELPSEVRQHLAAVDTARQAESDARTQAAAEWASAARALKDAGLTVRDIGAALKISHQRASQLVNG